MMKLWAKRKEPNSLIIRAIIIYILIFITRTTLFGVWFFSLLFEVLLRRKKKILWDLKISSATLKLWAWAKKLRRSFITSLFHRFESSLSKKQHLPATACATPARLKMLLRPMLCTQHPSRAAITVTDIVARPADKKNKEAFQHPGKTLASVAKPSTLKFAQCVLPYNCVQRLKIPTVGV